MDLVALSIDTFNINVQYTQFKVKVKAKKYKRGMKTIFLKVENAAVWLSNSEGSHILIW